MFESQFALASDRQLAAAGVTDQHRRRRIAEGDWRRPCPGVVALVGAPKDWRQTPMAVTLGPRTSVVGIGASARVHGLDGFSDHEAVDAFVERGARRSLPDGVIGHSSRRLTAADITTVNGIRVTSIATTLMHCAATYGIDDRTQQALDDALRKGKAPAWFLQTVERWAGRGVRGPNELRALLEARVGEPIPLSWFQRLAHRALADFGVRLEHEVPVYEGGRLIARFDLADVALKAGIECQSWDHHSTPRAQQADLERKRRVMAQGWTITEMWWFDLDRMDAVLDAFQLDRERQRRLLVRGA